MKSRLHETGTYKNLQMEIVAYREAMDIDVEFSNGFILQHTRYYNFQHRIFPMCVIRYHETSTALNGMVMTIVAYRTAHDMDVRFSTGEMKEHVAYGDFLSGKIKPVTTSPVGMVRTAKNDLRMKIVEYRGACDVDIMFEDGVINQHKAMKQFRSGQIGHPHIGTNSDGNFHGVKTQRGFSTEYGVYYICAFPDGTKDIFTPQEIMERMGIQKVF